MNELISTFKNTLFNNYANFSGRADRVEMWVFVAGLYLAFCIIYLLMYPFIMVGTIFGAVASSGGGSTMPAIGILLMYLIIGLIYLSVLIPLLGVSVRRLHDTGRSGWYVLLGLIPFLGSIPLIVLLSIDGDRGENIYGADPKIERYRIKD